MASVENTIQRRFLTLNACLNAPQLGIVRYITLWQGYVAIGSRIACDRHPSLSALQPPAVLRFLLRPPCLPPSVPLSNGPLSRKLEEFIDKHISSVAQMEVLLLLYRESKRAWSAEDVANALYIQPEAVAGYLDELVRTGCCLVEPSGAASFRYDPTDPRRHEQVQELANSYKTKSVAVIARIFSKPQNHLRLFSDAFKLRRDD